MTQINYSKNKSQFFNVLSDGKFHTAVPEGTEGSVKREYETSDGKKGVKNELIAESIIGVISNISIFEGDYGKNLQITVGELGKDGIVVSLSAASSFGEDFMKKLPAIDLDKEVKLSPYSFDDESGKKKKGLTIYQDDKKILNFYLSVKTNAKGEKKYETANGYPELPKESKNWDADDWKLYFAQARKFLLQEVQKSKVYNLSVVVPEGMTTVPYPKNDGKEIEF